jgi:PIN domain nuclease of toxin-antitoxin system
MIAAIADTHAVIWYLEDASRLRSRAKLVFEQAALKGTQIGISTITLVEMVYLSEKQRIPVAQLDRLMSILQTDDEMLVEVPITSATVESMRKVDRGQIPEMADRIIAATSLHLNIPLISRDHKITASSITTVW